MSKKKTKPVEAVEEIVEEAAAKPVRFINGTVTNCGKLNIRSAPKRDAAVVKVIDTLTKVKVDTIKSTEDFYKVRVAGIEGFCMKQYIAVDQ